MNIRKTTFRFVSTILMLIAFSVSAQEGVQNLAVVVNALENPKLGISTSLSIINLDEPDPKKAVKNAILPLGAVPSDVQIQGELGYVVNTFSNNVQITDLRNRASVGEIPIGDGTLPQQIAFISPSKAYVTCNGTDDIRVVEVKGRSVIKTIPGGPKPTGITVLNGKAYVTNSAFVVDPVTFNVTYKDSSVTVIDTQTDTVLKAIPVPTNATGVTTDGESKVLVLSAGDFNLIPGNLVIIDANRDEVERIVELKTTPGFSLVVNRKKQVFINDGFLTNRGLMVYDLVNKKWTHDRNNALAAFAGGAGMAVDQKDNVYVTFPDWTGGGLDELRIMGANETVIKTYRVGAGASVVAIAQIQPTRGVSFDVNNDGVVDIADLVIVASHFGEVGAGITGDVNGDGRVDIFDLVLVGARFGERLVAAAPFGDRGEWKNGRAEGKDERVEGFISRFTFHVSPDGKHHERIQQAIATLESYPEQSPTVRLVADLLRSYVATTPPIVTETVLLANYPNPFNPETWVPFQLSVASPVVIRIYDQSGQLVRTLDLGYRRAGAYLTPSQAAFWDGRNEIGEAVTSGVYFYQLLTDHLTATRKMTILK
ncbi:T9SS type A sorting domain-containing protein [Candidatus Poribacteria bacterium]|nr:T9SS type A sorting domain-containing protein [Candidatus Poribacteria bacterium]